MLRIFGSPGLFVFISVMIIAANIEVLKIVKFSLLSHPAALGTVFFAAAFWATDVLTEYYGPRVARYGILIGFAGAIIMIGAMTLSLGFRPLTALQISQNHLNYATKIQASLLTIFNRTPAIIAASLISYLCSQYSDVWIFKTIKAITGTKMLWFRVNFSTILAALLDSVIFNVLAWRIFTSHPLNWSTVFYTYIVATYLIRVLVSVIGTPAVYLARYLLPTKLPDYSKPS